MNNNNTDLPPALTPQNQYRIPPEFNGVQVNFCKNPECKNFGIPAIPFGRYKRGLNDGYKVAGSAINSPVLHCLTCDEYIPVKSNQGVSEEIERIVVVNTSIVECCPDSNCSNHNELDPILWKGKLMIFYQLVRSFHEAYTPSFIYRRV